MGQGTLLGLPCQAVPAGIVFSLQSCLLFCRDLASQDKARVFVTDSILTTIMCAAKSVYSWDVVVTRVGDKLFFDKREGSTLDLLTVNETAPEQVSRVSLHQKCQATAHAVT